VEYEGAGHGTSVLDLRDRPRAIQQDAAHPTPNAEGLHELEDPRQLIVTWLVERTGLGRLPRGAGR
jgi:hypothetical protein